MKKTNLCLIVIFIISLTINTIDLETNPIGLNQDEATNDYSSGSHNLTMTSL